MMTSRRKRENPTFIQLGIGFGDHKGTSIRAMKRFLNENDEDATTQKRKVNGDKTVEISHLEIIDPVPDKPIKDPDAELDALLSALEPKKKLTGERSEDSVLFVLDKPEAVLDTGGPSSVLASLEDLGRLYEERKADIAEAPAPKRDSSVMKSLEELGVIEDQRLGREKADECKEQLGRFRTRIDELKTEYEKTKVAYTDWGFEIEPVLEENLAALDEKYADLEGKLESAIASIELMPHQDGYKGGKELKAMLEEIGAGINSAIWSVGAGELQNRTLLVTLEAEKKEAERIEQEETQSGNKTSRLTKFFTSGGDGHVLGSGYFLELVGIDEQSCTFRLRSKADEYDQKFSLKAGEIWSDSVPSGIKFIIRWEPTQSGNYKVKIAASTKIPEEPLDKEVDELLSNTPPAEPSVEIDMSAEAPVQVPKPKGAIGQMLSGIRRWWKGEQTPAPAGKEDSDKDDQTITQDISLSDMLLEEPDEQSETKSMGIPWEDAHVEFKLNENEVTICEGVVDEKKMYWILPVPETKDAAEVQLLVRFAKDPVVMLRGSSYYVFQGDGFAGAKRLARAGDILHVWPDEMTDYDFLGSIKVQFKDPRKEVEWPERFTFYQMTEAECAAVPENKPLWLHPVPEHGSVNENDRKLLENLKGTKQITIDGRRYYVLSINSVNEWKEMVLYLPNTRIVSRSGNWLSIWKNEENGHYVFSNSADSGTVYFGGKQPSLKEKKGIRPHDSEKADIEKTFAEIKNVWLYELDDLSEIPSGQLSWIIRSSNTLIESKGISPILSIGGRWYAALDIFVPDSFRAVYNGENVVAIQQEDDHRQRLAEMRRKLASKRGVKFSIPPQPTGRDDVIKSIPDGEVRFLYYVGPENEGIALQRPTVSMTMDGEKTRYMIIDRYMEGVIPVVRRGTSLFTVRGRGDGKADIDEDSLELVLD